MPSDLVQQPLSESPLYIRWGPDKCPYAIELKLELVNVLRRAVAEAGARGLEVGGVLVGLLPTLQVPTLRIEDIELVARRVDDGPTFMLDGGGERFAEIRRRARTKERSVVGLFRSHLRSGPLRPSLADRTLLASEFKDPVYALLLAQGSDLFNAAFFVASNGPLPAEMSVREFRLDATDFESLPEVEPEFPTKERVAARAPARFGFGPVAIVFLIVLCVVGGLFYFNESIFLSVLPHSDSIGLTVEPQDGLLRIAWNHNARELDQSKGAVLTVRTANDANERRIQLGDDELRLGVVAVESNSPRVEVKLTFMNSGVPSSASKVWSR